MNILLYIVTSMVEIFLCLFCLAIVLRLFLPMFGLEEGLIYSVAVAISEPIVANVRAIIFKMEFFESSPMDFSYVITIMAIMVIYTFFPVASTFL